MSDNSTEVGVLGGAASGATVGASFGPVGAVVGGVIGAVAGYFASDSARKKQRAAMQDAERKAETARRESIIKQIGAKAQADSLTMGAMKTSSSSGTPAKANPTPGTVGANMTAAGNF